MFWRLLPHATICAASDRLILLDSRQDRYLMVPEQIAPPVAAWLAADHATPPPETLVRLLRLAGTLRASDPPPGNAERFEISIPTTLAGSAARQVHASARLAVFGLVMATWLGLRIKGFDAMLRQLARRTRHGTTVSTDAVLARIAVYDRARRYVPLPRNCLLDSLAQYRWLTRAGIGCQLVFGVTGQPFAAHCWLQSNEAILNDTYEHVSRFTPINVL